MMQTEMEMESHTSLRLIGRSTRKNNIVKERAPTDGIERYRKQKIDSPIGMDISRCRMQPSIIKKAIHLSVTVTRTHSDQYCSNHKVKSK